MRLKKSQLQKLIRECIDEMSGQIEEAVGWRVYWQDKKGKENAFSVKARDEKEAEAKALNKLRGRNSFYRILFVKGIDEVEESTTTADVQGYDAPFGAKLTDFYDDDED